MQGKKMPKQDSSFDGKNPLAPVPQSPRDPSIKAVLCPSCTAPISPEALKKPHPVCDHCGVTLSITNLSTTAPARGRRPAATSKQLNEWLQLAKEATELKDFLKASEWYNQYLSVQPHDTTVRLLAAGVWGQQGALSVMSRYLQEAVDLLETADARKNQEIAEVAFHFAKQSHAKLPPRYDRNHPMYPKSSALRSTTLKEINDILEFALRTAPSVEIREFAIDTYEEELDEIVYYTESPGYKLMIDMNNLPARAEAIRVRQEATIKALHAGGQRYKTQPPQQPRIQWNPITGEGKAGCGCLILIAVLSLTVTAFAFGLETRLP